MVELKSALRNLSFQDIAVFIEIAGQKSLAAAARELKLQPPYVTKVIQRLEQALEVQLLHRSTSGFSLTAAGTEFVQLCRSIEVTLEESDWSNQAAPIKQPEFITIGGPMFLLTHLAAEVLPAAFQSEPQGLRLTELHSTDMIKSDARSFLDAVIHIDKLNWGKAWQSIPVGSTEWVLCARRDHPLSSRVTEAEVLRFPFIVPIEFTTEGFRFDSDHCPVSSKNRLRLSEVTNAEIGLRIAEHTNQLIYFSDIQAEAALRHGTLRVLEVKEWKPLRKTVYLSVHRDKVTDRWLRSALKALEKAL